MKRLVLMIISTLVCGMVFTNCSSEKEETQEENFVLKIGEIIEGFICRFDVLPYPVFGEEQPLKTIKILVNKNEDYNIKND